MVNLKISLPSRKCKKGPEADLIKSFISTIDISLITQNNRCDLLVLKETRISANYPDLVLILLNRSKLDYWNEKRLLLKKNDIKILHHLYLSNKKRSIDDLVFELGFNERDLNKILRRLYNAEMILEAGDCFTIKNIDQLFFISDIISIEAKIKNWKDAFRQAELNYLFSSESYVLLPEKILNDKVISHNTSLNQVGIIGINNNKTYVVKKSQKNKIPASYYSWVLNEKIGGVIFNA